MLPIYFKVWQHNALILEKTVEVELCIEEPATPPTLTLLFKRGHTYWTCRARLPFTIFCFPVYTTLNLYDERFIRRHGAYPFFLFIRRAGT